MPPVGKGEGDCQRVSSRTFYAENPEGDVSVFQVEGLITLPCQIAVVMNKDIRLDSRMGNNTNEIQ